MKFRLKRKRLKMRKKLQDNEKIDMHAQKLQLLQDELSRSREYANSHPSNYKLICTNYIEKCMSFLKLEKEQEWTDRIHVQEISVKIAHARGELVYLNSTQPYEKRPSSNCKNKAPSSICKKMPPLVNIPRSESDLTKISRSSNE